MFLRFLKLQQTSQSIFISEIYFDSIILDEDRRFQLNGYSPIRPDHLSDTKRDGI